jgi:RNA polymerase sigma factor (sigma-70 family)
VEGRPLEDDELIRRAKDGDVGAYEELVRRYQGIAVRTAYLAAGVAGDAEDAAQEAFVKAFRALRTFRDGAPFRPWLLRIVANEARNRRRAARRRDRLALRLAAEHDRPSGGAAPSPEAAVLGAQEREALVQAMNAMREGDRLVLGYRFFLGLSEAETARVLGCAVGTVKSRQSRALRRLRDLLPALVRPEGSTGGGLDG